jgi:hypothetical protein
MTITFNTYLEMVREAQTDYPEWRIGQAYFNVLSTVNTDLAERVRASRIDPFYRDERLPFFLSFVGEEWAKKVEIDT